MNSFANPGRGLKSKNINRKQHRTAKMVSGAKKEADSDYLRQELSREKVRKEEFDIEDLHRDLEKKLEEQGFVFDKRKFLISEASATFLERLTDNVVKFVGSWAFIAAFLAFIGLWISLNFWIIYNNAFDPFPFSLLTTIVSLEAIILAISVLISQNRSLRVDDLREEIQLQIAIIAEKEVTKVMKMLALLLEKQGINISEDPELKRLIKPTSEAELERSLEKEIF